MQEGEDYVKYKNISIIFKIIDLYGRFLQKEEKMSFAKLKDLKKIFLLILLLAVGNTFTIYASEEQTSEAQGSTTKKRQRFSKSEINDLITSSPESSDDEAIEKPLHKAPKRDENAKSSGAAPIGLPTQPLASPNLLAIIHPSQDASSSPAATFSTPQPARKYASPPVVAPSTKPLEEEGETVEAKKVFIESRVKTNKLAYFYKDQYFDFTEWENQISAFSSKFLTSLKSKFKNHSLKTINMALAQLSLIYEIDSEIMKFDLMLPYFFLSRFPSEFEKSDIDNAILSVRLEMPPPYDTYNSFYVGSGKDKEGKAYTWKNNYKQFKTHLRDIIPLPENSKSSLIKERIETRNQQVNRASNEEFSSNYFHSEQAILIYLMQKTDEYLSQILPKITKGSTITTFLLNIVSTRDMCEKCGDTFFLAIEGNNITGILKGALEEKGYSIPHKGILFSVACIGLQAYSDRGIMLRDQKDQEICSVSRKVENNEIRDGIDLLSYKHPRITQRYL